MNKHTTKYFGEIELSIDEDGSWADFDTTYNEQEITVSLSDYGIYEDKTKVCWEIIDKYAEINEIAKKAIIENFPKKDGTVNYYFECHFDILDEEELIEVFGIKKFKDLDIKTTVEKMAYPDLLFGLDEGKLTFSVDYMIAKEYSDEILCVKMDE
ncbi:MAG: DUF2004 domain-containing protein, partial [Spirochaetales bacterium]|nr:DUF2004 domain-containing protein [Spirochaetales bacterium]